MNPFLKHASQFLSLISHPLLLPTYAFAMIIFSQPFLFAAYEGREWVLLVRVFINTFIFPVICLLLIWRLGWLKNMEAETREERIVPYIAIGTLYVWTYITFRKSSEPQILNIALLGACLSMLGCFLFNIFSKISIHAAGWGALVVLASLNAFMSAFDVRWVVLTVILLAGLVGSARLYLQQHTLREVMTGYLVGVAAQMFAFNYY
jgi:membrane-associated phospholipid phosphatase